MKRAIAYFIGIQEGFEPIVPAFECWNLLIDVPGHPKGSTVCRDTLEALRFELPLTPEYGEVAFGVHFLGCGSPLGAALAYAGRFGRWVKKRLTALTSKAPFGRGNTAAKPRLH